MKPLSQNKRRVLCILPTLWMAFHSQAWAEAPLRVQNATAHLPMSAPVRPLPVTICIEGQTSNSNEATGTTSNAPEGEDLASNPSRMRHCESNNLGTWEFEAKIPHTWQNWRVVIQLPPMESISAWIFQGHRLVPGTEKVAIGGGRTSVLWTPEAPLIPGTRYHLRLDGALNDLPKDVDGITYSMTNVYWKTSGDKPQPPTVQKKTKKKKKSHK